MIRTFVLRTMDRDVEVARKCYMSMPQAFQGFKKAALSHLGDSATWVRCPEMLFTGYYRNRNGDVLEMR